MSISLHQLNATTVLPASTVLKVLLDSQAFATKATFALGVKAPQLLLEHLTQLLMQTRYQVLVRQVITVPTALLTLASVLQGLIKILQDSQHANHVMKVTTALKLDFLHRVALAIQAFTVLLALSTLNLMTSNLAAFAQ